MNILVTGAHGQLGKCIQDLAKEHSKLDFIFTDYEDLDITKLDIIKSFFKTNNFDYCINCAAYTNVDKAETDSENAFLINAEAVKYLAEACKANNVVLIQISTDFVFDGLKETPYNEEDEPNPLNIYGHSKLKGEKYVQNIMREYFIIRTSWLYSDYGHNFVKTMFRLGAKKDEINVVNDQIGSPTYALDLASFILFLIIHEREDYGLFHYSNEGIISWYDFAIKIFEISEMEMKVNPISTLAYPTPAKRPKNSYLNKTKTENAFNIRIPIWSDSLFNCLLHLKSN